jgi:hypothetical protein
MIRPNGAVESVFVKQTANEMSERIIGPPLSSFVPRSRNYGGQAGRVYNPTAPFSDRVSSLVTALIQRIDLDSRLIPAETVSKR